MKIFGAIMLLAICLLSVACTDSVANGTNQEMKSPITEHVVHAKDADVKEGNMTDNTMNWLGGLAPEDALAYMKEHHKEGLVIVEVNTDYWKLKNGFRGAMHIPHDEMEKRYGEIPFGKPVILHCGGGIVSVDAYKVLQEKRKDIPQLSYIAGAPLVVPYNEWLAETEK
ncbi:hypothetical protein SAMN02745671_01074 [Anaerovibrio lipolyticus DSM 3074]|uniref:Rhodanese domain-containing protein n=1 Tax=Anaerovibrio lipolyticus DSM 3074 TaxID=1120997 RepID=A0A1M6CEP4_9FIRM|nr:hypothetical protein [Anaerovibrio lipolyticus]SHI59505.1 hypothetical protein SAMN02745671_01074 [Anaerovibrio lipolyticus DSM 3074]